MSISRLRRRIIVDTEDLLRPHFSPQVLPGVLQRLKAPLRQARQRIAADLQAFASRDAAASGNPEYVYTSYASFHAVMAYRVAHAIHHHTDIAEPAMAAAELALAHRLSYAARRLSEAAKVRTGIEIHPGATIGGRFVIDHGMGTVIGEQTRIGDDCYLLQNVVLGGLSVGNSSAMGTQRRHPHLGDRVQIAAGVMVLGPVSIGDDCVLEAGVRVTSSVPAGCRIKLISNIQISRDRSGVEIHGMVRLGAEILLTGTGLDDAVPVLLDARYRPVQPLRVIAASDRQLRCATPSCPDGRAALLAIFIGGRLSCCVAGGTVLHGLIRPAAASELSSA